MENEKSNTIRSWYNEVWNSGNAGAIAEMMHPEANAFGLSPEPIVGSDGFRPFYEAFNNDYAGIHVTVEKMLVDGDYVTAICTVTATHKQSGKPVNFMGTSITRVQEGKITEGWNFFDFLTLNLQTGKISPEQLV
ncbi:ester cyclase [Mucilaginibacter ginsenosidivorans]|uniref:Ester cyclase n=1 Tax=Mucilaginibacter ginsenosidivorans TaxID=398053 RepID=A0A5B8UZA4_9SPHI|nr:ester cyclase [Mucilaginibacter ginsenosidivorans]QEC63701.1 ester cyclase [Mucilaginibacter ginsenosidivorans]